MTKTDREAIQGLDERLQDQAAMVWKIEKVLREKVKAIFAEFKDADVKQAVTSTQGEKVLKANPAIAEMRALMRDYVAVVKVQADVIGSKPQEANISQIDAIRERLRIVK